MVPPGRVGGLCQARPVVWWPSRPGSGATPSGRRPSKNNKDRARTNEPSPLGLRSRFGSLRPTTSCWPNQLASPARPLLAAGRPDEPQPHSGRPNEWASLRRRPPQVQRRRIGVLMNGQPGRPHSGRRCSWPRSCSCSCAPGPPEDFDTADKLVRPRATQAPWRKSNWKSRWLSLR
jgi:hypothetical protein